jgi:ribosomal protein S18 acetylase RimI-like enzyme
VLKKPVACTEQELENFAQLVREGFDGSDSGLRARMQRAMQLALHHEPNVGLTAIAGLKSPAADQVRAIFETAGVDADPSDYDIELGWVYVAPEFRRKGIARGLCRKLLNRVGAAPLFATTRVENSPMKGLLDQLGFRSSGGPYPRRQQMFEAFLRG